MVKGYVHTVHKKCPKCGATKKMCTKLQFDLYDPITKKKYELFWCNRCWMYSKGKEL